MPNDPRPIQDLLSRGGIAPLVARLRQQAGLLRQVRQCLPPPLDAHTLSVQLKGRQLLLYCDSPVWASRLRFHSRELRAALAALGCELDKVTVRVTPQSLARRRPRSPVRRLDRQNAELLLQTADAIADPGLQRALRRLARHRR